MDESLRMVNQAGQVILKRVHWCERFFCKFRGLMLRASISPDEGLLLVEKKPSRVNASIHMFFMRFPIAAIWLNENFVVVDKALARPWAPAYAPEKPAQYTLEASPEILDVVRIGDVLKFLP